MTHGDIAPSEFVTRDEKAAESMARSNRSYREMLQIKKEARGRLLSLPGVRAVGLGGKVSAGKPIGELSIIVYVEKKKEADQLHANETIPSEINGVKTDVVEWPHRLVRYATLEGGDCISVDLSSAIRIEGTLGCMARSASVADSAPPDIFLSCRHVIYLTSDAYSPVQIGDNVTSPSCCGLWKPTIATAAASPSVDHYLDAAIASLEPGQKTAARIHGVAVTGILDLSDTQDLPQATQDALANHTYKVFKYGQKTGLTRGYVYSVAFDTGEGVNILPDTDQIRVAPIGHDNFAQSGDSGSVVYNEQGQIVGLLWAGDGRLNAGPPYAGVACHIQRVLNGFSGLPSGTIRVATNPPVVVYTVPGIRRPPLILERVHRDLARMGRGSHYIRLYGKHQEELTWLARNHRAFISAWHRNDGTTMGQMVIDLIENRLDKLPTQIGDQSWAERVRRIAGALLLAGSESLRLDVMRYASFVSSLGGHSYEDMLELMRAVATTED